MAKFVIFLQSYSVEHQPSSLRSTKPPVGAVASCLCCAWNELHSESFRNLNTKNSLMACAITILNPNCYYNFSIVPELVWTQRTRLSFLKTKALKLIVQLQLQPQLFFNLSFVSCANKKLQNNPPRTITTSYWINRNFFPLGFSSEGENIVFLKTVKMV